MTDPNDEPIPGYADVADDYWSRGWRGVLPITRPTRLATPEKPKGVGKWPPPDNFTGESAPMPSYPDVDQFKSMYATGHNTILRVPHEVVGIDVDAYGSKNGAATLAHALEQWGPLPPTVISTSRTDGVSGIRLFRLPAGATARRSVINFGPGLGDIEIVRFGHRYAVVWPSIHPDTGDQYQWLDGSWSTRDIPAIDDLAVLPPGWVAALEEGIDTQVGSVDVQAAMAKLSTGPMEYGVEQRLQRAIDDLGAGGGSRHDTTLGHVLALIRCSEQGQTGVIAALQRLRGVYLYAVRDRATPAEASGEFDRMILNERGHALIAATPSVDVDAVEARAGQLEAADEIIAAAREARSGAATFRDDLEHGDAQQPADAAAVAATPAAATVSEPPPVDPYDARIAELAVIEGDFWARRESLTNIYIAGHARMASPWAVLGVSMARAISQIPYWITLPPVIGGRGSLNFFVAFVGSSGAGKGAAEGAADELMPLPDLKVAPAGSGEGLVHQYAHMEKREMVRDANSVMFSIPEVDTLVGIGQRTGSTIMPKLRNAYSGEDLSFSYADPTKRIALGAHSYRMTMLLGVQPTRARPLIDDAAGGTPQRFIWMPTTDPRIGYDRPDDPRIITVPMDGAWGAYQRSLTIPDIARDTIIDARVARMQGRTDTLDGHALFTREKVMVALCALDGRTEPNEEDWELSGVVMMMSDRERAGVVAGLAAEIEREAADKGRAQGISRVASDDTVHERKLAAVVRWAAKKIPELLADGDLTIASLRRFARSDKRDLVEEAVTQLQAVGVVRLDKQTGLLTVIE